LSVGKFILARGRLFVLCGLLASVSAPCAAATTHFTLVRNGETRTATADVVVRGGVRCVSLESIARDFGAGYSSSGERVQVDFAGNTARLRFATRDVESSRAVFLLRWPLVRDGEDALIAVTDVPAFFRKAFGATVQARAPEPRDTPTEPAVEMHDLPEPGSQRAASEPGTATAPAPPERLEPVLEAVPATPPPRTIRLVVIDPGHGGSDTGCEGGGLRESRLTLLIAQQLKRFLEQKLAVRVALTRHADEDLTADRRANLANRADADLLISIHASASFGSAAHGFEIFCPDEAEYADLAGHRTGRTRDILMKKCRDAAASRAIAAAVGDALERTTGAQNRGIRQVRCQTLRYADMPAFLIEVGFLTNPAEADLLAQSTYQAQVAEGIADGLCAYVAPAATPGGTP